MEEELKMKKNRKDLVLIVCALFLVALSSSPALSADEETIIGTVNDSYQIVTDAHEVYEIGDSEQGDELVNLIGSTVEVTGRIEEQEGVKIITVTSFVVIEEASQEDMEGFDEEPF
jgi:hypothetical protein